MQAVTLHAFGVTVCRNNDNMKKCHDKKTTKKHTDTERVDLFSFFYHFFFVFCC